MKRTKKNPITDGMGGIIGIGLGTGICVWLLFMAVAAVFIHNEYLQIIYMEHTVVIIHTIAMFLASLTAGKMAKTGKFPACGAVLGGYILVLMVLSVVLFDGIGKGIIPVILGCVLGCTLGIFVSGYRKKAVGIKQRRARYR